MRLQAVLVFLSGFLTACSFSLVPPLESNVIEPSDIYVRNVPFFKSKQDNDCGPTALASMLAFKGVPVTPEDLMPLTYTPSVSGSLPFDMLSAIRRMQMRAVPVPSFAHLLTTLESGEPVLVLLNLTNDVLPLWHYAVVIGYQKGTHTVILHSGETRNAGMSHEAFETAWERSKRWGYSVSKISV
jgi:ABC-type bacteriocin/lantibiotic exporter with double-glycine peptidase domain